MRCIISLPNDNSYQQLQASEAKLTAQRLGIQVDILFAQNDQFVQSQQLADSIQSRTSRPDAILVEPLSNTGVASVATAAVSSGIPWVTLNFDNAAYVSSLRTNAKVPVFTVTRDHHEIGRIQGRQFGALLPKGGTVLYITGPTTSAAASQRTQGMQETKPQNVVIRSLHTTWAEEGAFRTVSSWVALNTNRAQNFNLVGCQYDGIAQGARRAFGECTQGAERDCWLSLPFTGIDGLPDEGQAWVNKGTLAATIVALTTAARGLEILVESLRSGKMPPESTFVEVRSYPRLEQLAAKAGR